jgi:hypothetical protein
LNSPSRFQRFHRSGKAVPNVKIPDFHVSRILETSKRTRLGETIRVKLLLHDFSGLTAPPQYFSAIRPACAPSFNLKLAAARRIRRRPQHESSASGFVSDLETDFLNMHSAGIGVALKKR